MHIIDLDYWETYRNTKNDLIYYLIGSVIADVYLKHMVHIKSLYQTQNCGVIISVIP